MSSQSEIHGVLIMIQIWNTRFKRLTGTVWLYPGPGPVGQTQPGGGTREEVPVHAGVNDRVGEGGPVQAKHSAVAGSTRITALDG